MGIDHRKALQASDSAKGLVGCDQEMKHSRIREMHCHRELQRIEAAQTFSNTVNRHTGSSVIEVTRFKFRRDMESPLCQIKTKLSTSDLNAGLAQFTHTNLDRKHRFHFDERKGRDVETISSLRVQQAFYVIGAEFPMIKFGERTGIQKNIRHLSFFT